MMRVLFICLGLAVPASADTVLRVPYETLEPRLVTRIDFEDYPRQLSPGTRLDDLQPFDGAIIGERFSGQSLSHEGGFDRLSPTPLAPLSLQAGESGENLAVSFIFQLSNQLVGLGPAGYPARESSGEGAVSVLFERDQFAVGFRVAADPRPKAEDPQRGIMTVAFYRRDGSVIDMLQVALDWGRGSYGFIREGEAQDIAGITIVNFDPEGIAIDDIIFDQDLTIGMLPDQPDSLRYLR